MNDFIKKMFCRACIYFTAISFFLMLLFWLVSDDLNSGMFPITAVFVFLFSLLFAFANLFFRTAKWGAVEKVLLHYILTVGGVFCFLYLPNKTSEQTASSGLILFLLFTLIYFIIMTVILVIKSRAHRMERDSKKYEVIYKK